MFRCLVLRQKAPNPRGAFKLGSDGARKRDRNGAAEDRALGTRAVGGRRQTDNGSRRRQEDRRRLQSRRAHEGTQRVFKKRRAHRLYVLLDQDDCIPLPQPVASSILELAVHARAALAVLCTSGADPTYHVLVRPGSRDYALVTWNSVKQMQSFSTPKTNKTIVLMLSTVLWRVSSRL